MTKFKPLSFVNQSAFPNFLFSREHVGNPKNSWTFKPGQKFKPMNLMPKIVEKLAPTRIHLAHVTFQIVRPGTNQITTSLPHFPEI